ncbi:MAG: F0F1 ATP synthase subunit gamma [Kiritimatiellae bacterium]|nr:F0F1 ATP synthase subunit gamma [Kiritimatiellia bacterium]
MAELRELERKLDSIKSLQEVVNAMRNLAAIYVRRAEAALEATRPYSETVETALRLVLERAGAGAAATPAGGRTLALVFAGDQGLCGTFNDRVVRAAQAFKQEAGRPVDFVAIGRRGHDLLVMRGEKPVLSVGAPTSLEGIKAQIPELAADVFEAYSAGSATSLCFVYNAYEGMGRFQDTVRQVLPPGLDRLGGGREDLFQYEPLLDADPADLLGQLIEEYFFVQLYRALIESHSSENGARLLSMTAASGNIDDRFTEVTKAFQAARQETITGELLDVVGGAEALRQERRGR